MESRVLEYDQTNPLPDLSSSQQNNYMLMTEISAHSQQAIQDKQHKINYALHYSKWHSDSMEHQAKMMTMYENMIKPYLPADKNARILDVGCGMGFLLLTLKHLGYKNLQGMEISEEQAHSCRQKNLDVIHTTDTEAALHASQRQFDVIFCMDVLEHIPVDMQLPFTSAIFAALKPGGKFICTVPNANSTLASRWRYIDWTHLASFTEHSIDFLLKNAGFTKIQVNSVDPFIEKRTFFQSLSLIFTRWLRRIEMIAELGEEGKSIPLSINLLVTSSKDS